MISARLVRWGAGGWGSCLCSSFSLAQLTRSHLHGSAMGGGDTVKSKDLAGSKVRSITRFEGLNL